MYVQYIGSLGLRFRSKPTKHIPSLVEPAPTHGVLEQKTVGKMRTEKIIKIFYLNQLERLVIPHFDFLRYFGLCHERLPKDFTNKGTACTKIQIIDKFESSVS